MVKLHLFAGFDNKHLRITPNKNMQLGHLYSDLEDIDELLQAGVRIRMKKKWLQVLDTPIHFDLWGTPLLMAKALFPVVTNSELVEDMRGPNRKGVDIIVPLVVH